MTPPRNVAHTKKVTDSDETTEPDRQSGIEHHVTDDAAGDEGIDEPAVDD